MPAKGKKPAPKKKGPAQPRKSKATKKAATQKAATASKQAKPKKPAKGKSVKRNHKKRRWLPLFLKCSLVAALLGAIAVIYLDAVVTNHFEGKRWAIPAKVYGRPLELYDGLAISEQQLAFELSQLNYRPVFGQQPTAGTFSSSGNQYHIHSRGFDFWEGAEPGQAFSLDLAQGQVRNLKAATGSAIVRLEPALIGGIYPAHNEDRVLVKLDQVPQQLVQALLAVEDRDFFNHFGISFKGIARALFTNVRSGEVKQGGSTLTQQLVKNFYLSSERSLSRKAIEAVMAVLLEFHYSKPEILEAYLNEVYLGQAGKRGIHGIGLASLFYFGQPLRELETHQIALLVGIIKGPSYYDPRRNPERALQRRNQVLQIMLQQGVLDQRAHDRVAQKPLSVIKKPLYEDARYPAFLDLMKRQLRQDYRDEDLRSEGLRIFTTLDPWVQERFERVLQQQLRSLPQNKPLNYEAAGVFTSSSTGEVVAVVGGKSVRYEGFNRALDAYRPIGSLAKPAVYLAALEQGYHLGSLLHDEAFEYVQPNGEIWSPQNFEKESHGPVPLIVALAQSYNQATAKLALDIGIESVVDVMARLGVNKRLPAVPALSLGAVSLSPYEVAQMYQTIAAEGFATPLRTIRSVLNAQGEPLQRYELEIEQRFDSAHMFLLTHGLQETVQSGTGKSALNWLPESAKLAGKTGTSDEQRDSWFAGFSGNYLGVVWVGVDDNKTTPLTGATGALPIWAQTLSGLPLIPLQPQQPDSVEWQWINVQEQARTASHCKNSLHIPMARDTIPQEETACGGGRVLNWFKKWLN